MQNSNELRSSFLVAGTVLCTLFLGFAGMMALVSLNWHHTSGISVLLFPAWVIGLVFRIIRPTFLKLIILLVADLFIALSFYDELILRHDFSLHPHMLYKPFFWATIACSIFLVFDWVARFRAARLNRKESY